MTTAKFYQRYDSMTELKLIEWASYSWHKAICVYSKSNGMLAGELRYISAGDDCPPWYFCWDKSYIEYLDVDYSYCHMEYFQNLDEFVDTYNISEVPRSALRVYATESGGAGGDGSVEEHTKYIEYLGRMAYKVRKEMPTAKKLKLFGKKIYSPVAQVDRAHTS